ncbi:DUF1499 domain-containing protein [Microvirga flavescens]|uniref:DUF1499 domain-containing protein n=1 Tax=Microvirga flavescens TaxID=2249811 RepID=UPI000DD7E328|nr:DUF1499 domain-containing protein [Microvirga flavescens]
MRHLIIEEPVTRPAKWSPMIAWFAIAVAALAALLIRFERIDYEAGFIALGAGGVLALLAILLSGIAFVRIWQEGRQGFGSAVFGIFLAALLLAYPAWLALQGVRLPPVNDISTDIESPPGFSRSRAVLAARGGWVPPEVPLEKREAQRAAYREVAPLSLDMGPVEAFALVRKAAANLGWQVIETRPPGGRTGSGYLEAVDRTLLLRLPGDVTVRVRPRADGARIDIRSASRFGTRDFGTNAKRIRAFLDEVSNLAIAAK